MTSAIDWPDFSDGEKPLTTIVKLSRYYGSDPEFVLAGGGNTSVKVGDKLHVKASGIPLAGIDEDGFVELDRDALQGILGSSLSTDRHQRESEFKQAVLAARTDTETGLRPSVESVLHHLTPGKYTVHTHSTVANMVTCCSSGGQIAREIFGDDVLWIPFVDPGFVLAQTVNKAIEDYRERTGKQDVPPILMENHGLLVFDDDPEQIRRKTDDILGRIGKKLDQAGGDEPFGPVRLVNDVEARELVDTIGPLLRGMLAADDNLAIVRFEDSLPITRLVGGPEGQAAATGGPLSPDQIVYCLSFPLWLDPGDQRDAESLQATLRQAIDRFNQQYGYLPKVILVKGLGMFTVGESFASADSARLLYVDAAKVMGGAKRFGGIQPLEDATREFIENWEVEAYRRKVAARQASRGRAAGKVALVTGAAQGFGLEIARDLNSQGACVILADVNIQGAGKAAEELNATGGSNFAVAVEMDVTSSDSAGRAIHEAVRNFGGLDVLISNAGVLRAQSVKTQSEADFDFVTSVNYKGYFVCVQNVAPVLALQHKARPQVMSDIIQINSKSGLVGSNRNFAYAGSKFGSVGLTQSFALELIADGVKVNSICPGNFFDGPLWSDPENGLFVQYLRANKVPGAKTVEDVRKAYEQKVPMKRGCRARDVMAAIYYLMEQEYETGQAVPVTGGQVMLR
jgi:rhamnose utilization protein RhaD (predicted bifunctional aldolase and dehydrogenase)/NAD(P)-dependent dehydrogenase (short-subunit alcohol dehydrogenase family)